MTTKRTTADLLAEIRTIGASCFAYPSPYPASETKERITVTPIPEHWYTPGIRYEALLREMETLIALQFEESDDEVMNHEFAAKLHGMILGFRCGIGHPDVGNFVAAE